MGNDTAADDTANYNTTAANIDAGPTRPPDTARVESNAHSTGPSPTERSTPIKILESDSFEAKEPGVECPKWDPSSDPFGPEPEQHYAWARNDSEATESEGNARATVYWQTPEQGCLRIDLQTPSWQADSFYALVRVGGNLLMAYPPSTVRVRFESPKPSARYTIHLSVRHLVDHADPPVLYLPRFYGGIGARRFNLPVREVTLE